MSDSLPDGLGTPYMVSERYDNPNPQNVRELAEGIDGGHDLTTMQEEWDRLYGPDGIQPAP